MFTNIFLPPGSLSGGSVLVKQLFKLVWPKLPIDIGSLFKSSMSTTDIVRFVSSLNQEQKYNLLKSHFVPSDMFSFPKEYSAGCNRCFQAKWLKQYPRLVYSKTLDGGFCVFLK